MALPESLFGLFLVQIAAGVLVFLPWLGQVGRAFIRLNALLALGLLGVVCASQLGSGPPGPAQHAGVGLATLIGLLMVHQGVLSAGNDRVLRATTSAVALGAVIAAGLYFRIYLRGDGALADGLRLAGLAGSAACLGSCLVAMILGHWYLVNFDLSLAPFRLMGKVLLGALGLRLVLSVAAIGLLATTVPGVSGVEDFAQRYAFELIPRVAFGLLAPLGIAWMAVQTIALGNKQAATGLLYAAIVPILIGETMANIVFLVSRVPA